MKKLERKLSLLPIIAISIAGMLGGIFVLPGIAAAKTGASIWLAFLLAAICIFPAVLSKAELATAMPKSGGTYVYIERAFGPIFGTISGIGLWLSLLLKSAFALVGFGAYLSVLISTPYNTELIVISSLILIMIMNILGVKKVGKMQIIIISISLLGLISLIIMGLPNLKTESINPFLTDENTGLVSTIAFVYIAYAGVTKIAAIAGEVKNPSKNIPLGMILSLVIVTVIYVSITYLLAKVIPLQSLSTDIKPIYSLANIIGGPLFGIIIAGISIITLISMANSGVLATSRFPFAMSLDNLLPAVFGRVHSKYLTPVYTIVITCTIMALVILFLDVEKIAKLASGFKVMMFISVNACVIVLRETAVQWYTPKYKSPLYPFVQIFGILTGIILLFYLGWMPIIAILFISILGTLTYIFFGRKALRTGVLKKYGHIPTMFLFFKKQKRHQHLSNLEKQKEESIKDIKLSDDSEVIIPLLGNEKSPEMLIEIAASINTKERLQVVKITEVPDQTILDALIKKNKKDISIERQISVLMKEDAINIDFESIVTHELSKTIQELSEQGKCKWLVFGWNGRAYNGILFYNPIGWIVTNIKSNFALFKDNGVRYIKRVVLAVRPNSKDLEKLINTTNHLCEFYNATFTLLHIINDSTTREEIINMENDGKQKLKNKKGSIQIIQSNNPTDTVSEITANYDLLILGTPKKDTWFTMLFGTGTDKFAINSECSVLRLTINS